MLVKAARNDSQQCCAISYLHWIVLSVSCSTIDFSVPLKKEHKENRRKNEEECHQMCIDFKPIYKTLEAQTIFVRGLCPKTPLTRAAYSTPRPSS